MKTIIIHHHDLDGYAAGAIARLFYPEAATLSLNYDASSPIPTADALADYAQVIIVDYTLPPAEMLALYRAQKLLWIDHHASAIRNAQTNGYADALGLRCAPGELICASELCWQFFVKKPLPRFLTLIGGYDTFRNSHDPEFTHEVLPFFYGTQVNFQERFLPANFGQPGYLLNTLEAFEDEALPERMIADGRVIQGYNRSCYGQLLRECAFVREIDGLRVLCFNCAGHGSDNMIQAFDPAKHDAMLLFSTNGKGWNYGIYTDGQLKPEVDVSAIAIKHGGGGHRCAAGFRTEEILPELLPIPNK
jgi:oligoribonuclease NrnB/cAMP/cGMP phosphodiesterase (DHH superfamily)